MARPLRDYTQAELEGSLESIASHVQWSYNDVVAEVIRRTDEDRAARAEIATERREHAAARQERANLVLAAIVAVAAVVGTVAAVVGAWGAWVQATGVAP